MLTFSHVPFYLLIIYEISRVILYSQPCIVSQVRNRYLCSEVYNISVHETLSINQFGEEYWRVHPFEEEKNTIILFRYVNFLQFQIDTLV